MNVKLTYTLFLGLLAVTACTNEEEENKTPVNDFPVSEDVVSIPRPPEGQRWVVNEEFSDEFNGTELDASKWYDYHPNWKGRSPGLFMPSQISFSDGNMVFTGEKMERDTTVSGSTFNIRCAAVVSKRRAAHYGYYECRFKANKTTLSTTFWLSSAGESYSTEGRQPEGAEVGTFNQELDICESIGRTDVNLAKGMNSNIHYWFTPTGGSKEDIKPTMKLLTRPDGGTPADDYNIYGCWWKDEEEASFYLNNAQGYDVPFVDATTSSPFRFTEPMHLNMVMETYDWVDTPNDEELADPTKNKSYYDWVRCYVLEDQDTQVVGANEYVMFENHLHFYRKSRYFGSENGALDFLIDYTASKDSEIELVIYNADKTAIYTQVIPAYAGYAAGSYPVSVSEAGLVEDATYYAVATLRAAGSTTSYEVDSFGFTYDGDK